MAAVGSFELFSNDSPFSLQHEAPFVIQGKTFNCVLQYLMYRKAVLFNDKETAEDIMETQNPDQYELFGGQILKFHHTTWHKERMKYLDLALEAKFTQVPDFKGQLLATHPRLLAYASPEDNIWGIGLTKTNPMATVRRHWKGDNDLGNALTRIRDKHIQMENRLEEGIEWEDEEADGNTNRDERRQDRQGNSQRQASQESKGRGESRGVGGQGSKDGKLKRKREQTDHIWDKRRRGNMGPRNTKTSYTEMPNQDKFILFFGNQSPFSQHHRASFTIDGTTFNCAEQYMMYQKTVIFGNKEMELKIMATSNPVQQKRYGRQIPEFKFEVWKKHFIDVVDRATEAKFTQNPHLLKHLFATHPKLLVEASPSDRLWGIGRGQKDPLAWDKETWRGKNQLGYIITRVRDRLMKVKDTHWEEWEKWKDDKRWEEEVEKDVRRKKRNKRRLEPDQSVSYRGRHEERTPKTRLEGDRAEEDSITFLSKSVSFQHVSGKENFEFFGGIKSPFSQRYPASFTIDGQTFTSAEQFTLYQMAVIFEDEECQEKIMSTSDPSEQERYTYEITNFRWDVWEQKCVKFVERGITAKFTQNSDLRGQLFATYPKLLAECKYDDVYWSIGYGLGFAKKKCEAWDTNMWRGWNVLGYTLTDVRDRLMKMEKGQKKLDVEDVSRQATIEGKFMLLDRKILVAEEAGVGGEDGEDVTTEKDKIEVGKEIQRTDRDVEEDESKPHRKQDVQENFVSEEEEVTVGGSKLRGNKDADSTLAGDRYVMERDQRARNSVGEGRNNGYVPLEGEDDGREDEGIAGLDSTELGEGNVAEQHKVEKRIGKELKKVEEVTPLAEHVSLTKEKNEEEERTENEEMETLENGGEKLRLVESGVEGENATKERGMRIEEQLDVGGKTVGEVAKIEEVNKVVADVSDRVDEDERVTVVQQESVGEIANIEEGVTQVLEKEPFVEGGRGEREASERNEVKKEKEKEVTSVQEGTERDGEGGRKVQEQVKKEGDSTGKDVKTAEYDMSVPSDIVGDGERGRKVQERVKKDGDNTEKDVKTIEEDKSVPPDIGGDGESRRKVQERFEKEGNDTGEEEVPLVEAASVVDGGDTKKDPKKVNSELNGMVVEDFAEGVCKDVEKLNEAKSGEDVMSGPEDNVVEKEGEGERKDPDHKTGVSDILDESKTEKRMPEASTLFEEKYADESQSGVEEETEKGDTGDGEDVMTEEEVRKNRR